jgi:predicted RNA-binding protein Jag
MSNTIESKGRSVEEAISEALLRTGWRRDEVDVTVLEQPKGGFLGLGSKPAKVRVERKGGGDRRGRGRRDEARLDAPRGDRRGDARGGRDRDRGRDRDQRGGRTQDGRSAEARTQEGPASEARGEQRGGEGRREGGRGEARGGRDRDRDQRGGRGRDRDRPRQESSTMGASAAVETAGERTPASDEGGRSSSRRRRRRPTRQRDEAPVETLGAAETSAILAEAVVEVPRVVEASPPSPEPVTQGPEMATGEGEHAPRPTMPAAEVLDEPRAPVEVTVKASERITPYGRTPDRPAAEILQTVTTDLMRHAGFPCRCEVKEGEYDLVKLIVEDRSAQVLIGRYGAAVDAIEHLVEKISSQAAGERVRMNLDVNNFRRRREEHLVQVARSVVREVRETGQPVHLDPLCARERRIIHLQVLDIPGMATYTVQDENGKHVVVATEDYVRAAAEAAGDAHLSHESDDHADDLHGEGVAGNDAGDRA